MVSAQRLGLTKIGIVGSEQFIDDSPRQRHTATQRSQNAMDYARQQRDPARHLIGIAFVVLMHVLLIWAMMTGLARKAVEVDQEAADGDDHRGDQAPPPPPPPPPKKIVEEPKVAAAGADLRAAAGHPGRRPRPRRR